MNTENLAKEWIHVCRPASGMPELMHTYTEEEIGCAFPEMFEFLAASMFLNPDGYGGAVDDDQKPSPGTWYGLSWGCVHRDTLYVWQPVAKQLRRSFWMGCWKWISSCGKTPIIEKDGGKAIFLAFADPLPILLFERAVIRLSRKGMLVRSIEELDGKRFPMYYPTRKLYRTLEKARYVCRTNDE